ncbi:aminotransferase class I/II-fold pyridoxal phosphate-dependent enzyme, partial [Xylella fastidiosa subsp. multiplex]|nr:aminotransferase class I/II-fold pyridoxal phosphate-dependent enzyme [Xylella fastidiosa subsp. multiplex]
VAVGGRVGIVGADDALELAQDAGGLVLAAGHGDTIVSTVLNTPELFAMWEQELAGMRDRIRLMRKQLVEKIKEHGGK